MTRRTTTTLTLVEASPSPGRATKVYCSTAGPITLGRATRTTTTINSTAGVSSSATAFDASSDQASSGFFHRQGSTAVMSKQHAMILWSSSSITTNNTSNTTALEDREGGRGRRDLDEEDEEKPEGVVMLKDLGSTNGTFVQRDDEDEVMVLKKEDGALRLLQGDVITFGQRMVLDNGVVYDPMSFVVHIHRPPAPSPTLLQQQHMLDQATTFTDDDDDERLDSGHAEADHHRTASSTPAPAPAVIRPRPPFSTHGRYGFVRASSMLVEQGSDDDDDEEEEEFLVGESDRLDNIDQLCSADEEDGDDDEEDEDNTAASDDLDGFDDDDDLDQDQGQDQEITGSAAASLAATFSQPKAAQHSPRPSLELDFISSPSSSSSSESESDVEEKREEGDRPPRVVHSTHPPPPPGPARRSFSISALMPADLILPIDQDGKVSDVNDGEHQEAEKEEKGKDRTSSVSSAFALDLDMDSTATQAPLSASSHHLSVGQHQNAASVASFSLNTSFQEGKAKERAGGPMDRRLSFERELFVYPSSSASDSPDATAIGTDASKQEEGSVLPISTFGGDEIDAKLEVASPPSSSPHDSIVWSSSFSHPSQQGAFEADGFDDEVDPFEADVDEISAAASSSSSPSLSGGGGSRSLVGEEDEGKEEGYEKEMKAVFDSVGAAADAADMELRVRNESLVYSDVESTMDRATIVSWMRKRDRLAFESFSPPQQLSLSAAAQDHHPADILSSFSTRQHQSSLGIERALLSSASSRVVGVQEEDGINITSVAPQAMFRTHSGVGVHSSTSDPCRAGVERATNTDAIELGSIVVVDDHQMARLDDPPPPAKRQRINIKHVVLSTAIGFLAGSAAVFAGLGALGSME